MKNLFKKVYNKINSTIFSRNSQFQTTNVDDLEGMNEIPFAPENVLEGSPKMTTKLMSQSGDGGLMTGLWDCTAGRFMWYFKCDEVVHIIKGEVIVNVNGRTETLREGSTAFFPIGTVSEWHVPNYVLKTFSHRNPTPTLKKIFG